MIDRILQIQPLPSRSLLQRLFRQYPVDYPMIKLNNQLVEKGFMLAEQDIDAIDQEFGSDVRKTFNLNLQEVYAAVLNFCLKNGLSLTDDERLKFNRLKKLFRLSPEQIAFLEQALGEYYYRHLFEGIVSKGWIHDHDRTKLNRLASNLQLPADKTTSIARQLSTQHVHSVVKKFLQLKKLSTEQVDELNKIAENFGVSLHGDRSINSALKKAARLWELDNTDLKPIHILEFREDNEECYFFTKKASWHEIRINKGSPYLKLIDSGSLILTDRRIIFNGSGKVIHLKFNDIVDFIVDEDLIEIRKVKGKYPSLGMNDLDEFIIIFSKLINHFRS